MGFTKSHHWTKLFQFKVISPSIPWTGLLVHCQSHNQSENQLRSATSPASPLLGVPPHPHPLSSPHPLPSFVGSGAACQSWPASSRGKRNDWISCRLCSTIKLAFEGASCRPQTDQFNTWTVPITSYTPVRGLFLECSKAAGMLRWRDGIGVELNNHRRINK